MLVGRERPGVDVDVGIDFDGRHADVAVLEDGAERAGDDTLAHAANHAAGHQDVLHDCRLVARRARGRDSFEHPRTRVPTPSWFGAY